MNDLIRFNIPLVTGGELDNLKNIFNKKFSGDGIFTKKCNSWLENNGDGKKARLTTSCTHALDLASILIDTKPGDEIIMPL